MLIFGHNLIKNDEFIFLNNKNFKKEYINCFYYDEKLIQEAINENIKFATIVKDENELILSNALNANFILLENENLAKISAKIAEFYMFDSKILLIYENLKNLKKIYDLKLDGIILKESIKNF